MDAQAVGLGNQQKMFLQHISSKLNLEKEKKKKGARKTLYINYRLVEIKPLLKQAYSKINQPNNS